MGLISPSVKKQIKAMYDDVVKIYKDYKTSGDKNKRTDLLNSLEKLRQVLSREMPPKIQTIDDLEDDYIRTIWACNLEHDVYFLNKDEIDVLKTLMRKYENIFLAVRDYLYDTLSQFTDYEDVLSTLDKLSTNDSNSVNKIISFIDDRELALYIIQLLDKDSGYINYYTLKELTYDYSKFYIDTLETQLVDDVIDRKLFDMMVNVVKFSDSELTFLGLVLSDEFLDYLDSLSLSSVSNAIIVIDMYNE